jgi:hypothetical protein
MCGALIAIVSTQHAVPFGNAYHLSDTGQSLHFFDSQSRSMPDQVNFSYRLLDSLLVMNAQFDVCQTGKMIDELLVFNAIKTKIWFQN